MIENDKMEIMIVGIIIVVFFQIEDCLYIQGKFCQTPNYNLSMISTIKLLWS